jgi:hypothetical protein
MSTYPPPLLDLLAMESDLSVLGTSSGEKPQNNPEGAVQRLYSLPNGQIIVTLWQGRLHEVIYQTPCNEETDRVARNERLFAHYGEEQEWKLVRNDSFGKVYGRADDARYAFWSIRMDYLTFGSMAYHAQRYG